MRENVCIAKHNGKIAIVNVFKDKQTGLNMYTIVDFMYNTDIATGETSQWQFRKLNVDERNLMSIMRQGIMVINAVIDRKDGKYIIKGNHGSLDRFKTGKELVVLSEIKYLGEDRVIGYRVASSSGQVKCVQAKVLKENCLIAMEKYGVEFPLQNMIFAQHGNGDNSTLIIRRNNIEDGNGGIIDEILIRNKNKHTVATNNIKVKDNNVDTRKFDKVKDIYTPEQLKVIKDCRLKHRNLWKLITNKELSAEQMKALSAGLDKKVDIRLINEPEFDVGVMRLYIDDMENGNDIRHYLNPKYNMGQVMELGLAYEEGLDISKMANPKHSESEMAEIRMRLETDTWKECFVREDSTL